MTKQENNDIIDNVMMYKKAKRLKKIRRMKRNKI